MSIFFFQAEDGIRDLIVTGVQTCALPISCGADYPLRVSALGDSGPLGYNDEAPVPPGAIPNASMPQHWPVTQPSAPPSSSVRSQQMPPLQSSAPQSYPSQPYPQQSYPPRYPPPRPYPPPPA